MTRSPYKTPRSPPTPSTSAALESEGQGALRIAETSRTAQKWTMVGVAKARVAGAPPSAPTSAPRTITTNCRPVRAAAEDPTMT